MNGKPLAIAMTFGAVLLGGAVGWALLHDDSPAPIGPGPSHSNVATTAPQQTTTLNPGQNTPVGRPLPSATPRVAPSAPTVTETGPPAVVTAATRNEKITSVKSGKGAGLIVAVSGPDGKPVAGAIVDAGTTKRRFAARSTTLEGLAQLDPAPADEGKISGTVKHVKYPQAVTFSADAGTQRVTVKLGGGGKGGDAQAPATGFINGTIHDSKGNAPPRADLQFYDDTGLLSVVPSESFVTWAGGGRFRAEVAPGTYTITAIAPGYSESDKSYVNVTPDKDSAQVDLVVAASGTISGHVTLPPELQSSRDPIPVGFDLECVTGTAENPNTTSKHVDQDLAVDGAFLLDSLQPGNYKIRATNAGRVSAWVPVLLAEGANSQNVTLGLAQDAASRIKGTVRDTLGQPVPNATIADKVLSTVSDANGVFELRGVDGGHHELRISGQGYVSRIQGVEIMSGTNSTQTVDIGVVTLPRCGSATGVVTRGGKAAGGVSVMLVMKAPGGGIQTQGPVTTDGAGSWRIDQLPPGAYYIKAGDTSNPWDDNGTVKLQVRSGEVVTAPTVIMQ